MGMKVSRSTVGINDARREWKAKQQMLDSTSCGFSCLDDSDWHEVDATFDDARCGSGVSVTSNGKVCTSIGSSKTYGHLPCGIKGGQVRVPNLPPSLPILL